MDHLPHLPETAVMPPSEPSARSLLRAWLFLILLSARRQARARLMVWVALGLLAFVFFVVWINTQNERWSMSHWRAPRRTGPTYAELVQSVEALGYLPWDVGARSAQQLASAAYHAAVFHGSGFFVFSNWMVFSVFATFLLPLWTLSFATEGLGREREDGNLVWLLSRPVPRWAIYLGKFLALLPWCLVLNVGGFAALCWAAGPPGMLALRLYWPAVFGTTVALAALFHLLAAWLQRPAVAAILYSFFLETVVGNLPQNFKRLSISFYGRCLMFESAHDFGIRPERPSIYVPVSGATAWWVLASLTAAFLLVGLVIFCRREYAETA